MKTILHLHIPRAGGSSVNAKIASTLGGAHCINGNSHQELASQIPSRAQIKYATGHFFWGLHKYFPRSVYFIVLRHPIDRVGSLYDYINGNTQHPKHGLYTKHSLLQILALPDIEITQMSNGQIRQLVSPAEAGRAVTTWHFFQALRNLFRRSVIVTFPDQIEFGLEKLNRKTNCRIPTDIRVINQSVRRPLEFKERKRICSLNIWDLGLYYIARACFGFQPRTAVSLTGISLVYGTTLQSCTMQEFSRSAYNLLLQVIAI